MSSSLLPPGWEKVVDPSSGRNYFQHAASHTSSWTVPTHEPASLSSSSTSIADPHAHDDGVLLQSGWSRVVCPTSGKGYYQNLSTRESSWDVPKAPLAAEAPPAAHTATPSTAAATKTVTAPHKAHAPQPPQPPRSSPPSTATAVQPKARAPQPYPLPPRSSLPSTATATAPATAKKLLHEVHPLPLSVAAMRKAYVAIDTDGNGTLDAEESARGLMTLMPIERCQVDALVKKFDTDGDGVISFAEFVAMARCLHDIRSNVHALHTSSDELPSGTRAGAAAKSGLAPAATGLLLSKEVELLDGPYRKIRRTPLSKALEADPWEKRFLVFTGHWVVVYRSVSCFSRGDAPLIALSSLEIDAMKLVGASLKKLQLTTSNSHGTLTISYRSPTDAKQWMWEISHHQYRLVATMDHKIEAARQAGFDDEKVRKYATGRYATGRGDGGDLILVGLIVAALCTYQAGLFAPDLAAIAAPGFLEIGDAFTGGLDTAGGEASTGLEGIGDAFSNLGNKLDNVDLPDINCAPM